MSLLLAAVVHLTFQNHARRYLLHVPARLPARAPLVLVFHGGSEPPENMEKMSRFDELADREHFIVAYPAAVDKNWADGRGSTPEEQEGIDDVGFVRAVIADIRKQHPLDDRRIFATGPSNGGIFSNRLGCEMADTFAAIGPVIGTMASNLAPNCKPSQPISVVGIQGLDDPLMPFAGGEEGGLHHLGRGGRIEGGRATQELWARLNGCSGAPSSITMLRDADDGTRVVKRSWSRCRAGSEVAWYEIEGGGHRWPPRQGERPAVERLARKAFGVSSQNIDATKTLWEFFKRHAKGP